MEALKPFAASMPDAEFVIIEMFGGDNNLSQFVYQDLQEMAAGLKGKMAVIGLTDLADKPASVVEVTPSGGIQSLEDWGEIDTGDPEVLLKFVAQALMTYPNARKAIGFWDHGTGVFDETDASEKLLSRRMNSVSREDRSRSFPARRLFFPKSALIDDPETRGMLHDDTNGGVLTNLEAAHMIRAAFQAAGQQGKIDVIFSDTCLNGMIEVVEELAPYAHCVVGSPELEPGDGWDYEQFTKLMGASPPATPGDWGKLAVEAFNIGYEPQTKKYPCTLAAVKSDNQITAMFKALLEATRSEGGFDSFFFLDHARAKAQCFARKDTYDLQNFAERLALIAQNGKPKMAQAARDLVGACEAARVHNCCLGKTVVDSKGLAFWFPSNRAMMGRDIGTYERLTFSTKTGWSDFLKEFR